MSKILVFLLICFKLVNSALRSPCPEVFQIVLENDDRPSAIIKLDVDKSLIYEFNVTAIFVAEPNVKFNIFLKFNG